MDAAPPADELPAASAASTGSNGTTKARRVRKPRSIELAAETLSTEDDHAEDTAAPAPEARSATKTAQPTATADHAPASPVSPEPSAVQWDASTGAVTFDWPAIEHVAATGGANQAMAKLLLAARAEGASSRWPF